MRAVGFLNENQRFCSCEASVVEVGRDVSHVMLAGALAQKTNNINAHGLHICFVPESIQCIKCQRVMVVRHLNS